MLHLTELRKCPKQQLQLTLCVIIVLGGLNRLAYLHTDDVNFCLAVLQHLLSCLQHFLILCEIETNKQTKNCKQGILIRRMAL